MTLKWYDHIIFSIAILSVLASVLSAIYKPEIRDIFNSILAVSIGYICFRALFAVMAVGMSGEAKK